MSSDNFNDIVKPGELSDRDRELMQESAEEKIKREMAERQRRIEASQAQLNRQQTITITEQQEDTKEEEESKTVEQIEQKQEQQDPTKDNPYVKAYEKLNEAQQELIRKYSTYDTFTINFDDNTSKTYYRKGGSEYLIDILDEKMEEISNTEGNFLDKETRKKEREFYSLMAQHYLIDIKTKMPMTMNEYLHAADNGQIRAILMACYFRHRLALSGEENLKN